MTDEEWEIELKDLILANHEFEMECERLQEEVQAGNRIIAEQQDQIEHLEDKILELEWELRTCKEMELEKK